MLLFKTLFITIVLFITCIQCSLLSSASDLGQNIKMFLGKKTSLKASSNLVQEHTAYGLKDHKYSVKGLDSPEIREKLKNMDQYVVLELDMSDEDTKALFKDTHGNRTKTFSHSLENAIICVALLLCINLLRAYSHRFLTLIKSPSSHIF